MKKIMRTLIVIAAFALAAAGCQTGDKSPAKDQSGQTKVDKDLVKPQPREKSPDAAAEGTTPPGTASGAVSPESRPPAGTINIFYKGQTLTVSGRDPRWELKDGGKTYALESQGGYAFKFFEDGRLVAEGGFKEDKLKFKRGDALFLKLKFKSEPGKDKIKVSLKDEEENPWELKYKEDKVKVERGEVEYGKVKYYPDTGKLKCKDAADNEVASTTDLSKLSGVLGVFLLDDLDPSRRACLLLTLLALGR